MPIILQLSQEDHEFENSLGCIMRRRLKKFSAEVFATSIKYILKVCRQGKELEEPNGLRQNIFEDSVSGFRKHHKAAVVRPCTDSCHTHLV